MSAKKSFVIMQKVAAQRTSDLIYRTTDISLFYINGWFLLLNKLWAQIHIKKKLISSLLISETDRTKIGHVAPCAYSQSALAIPESFQECFDCSSDQYYSVIIHSLHKTPFLLRISLLKVTKKNNRRNRLTIHYFLFKAFRPWTCQFTFALPKTLRNLVRWIK